MKRLLYISLLGFGAGLLALALFFGVYGGVRVLAQGQSIAYGLSRERLDFPRSTGQVDFTTPVVYPRSNYIEVFVDGSLQRSGEDYTTAASGGAVKVTFKPRATGLYPSAGSLVTVFYYR
jgi:hypothetical protein